MGFVTGMVAGLQRHALDPAPLLAGLDIDPADPARRVPLDRYAALHAQTYGEAVDATVLIPHMLEAFMAGDRGFRKGGAGKAAPSKPS